MWIAVLVVTLAFAAAVLSIVEWRRTRKLLAAFRGSWGAIKPATRLSGHDISAAFQHDAAHGEMETQFDARTWSDLHLDDCIATLDRTLTRLGRQNLYRRVRGNIRWTDQPHMDALHSVFMSGSEMRERVAYRLLQTDKGFGQDIWFVTRPGAINTRWWFWCFPFLTAAMVASLVILPFAPAAIAAAAILLVVNMVARVAAEWQVPHALTSMRQVGPVLRVASDLARSPSLRDLAVSASIRGDIDSLRALRRITSWLTRDSASIGEGLASLYEYLNIVFLLDGNALLFARKQLDEKGNTLRRIANFVGDVDVALSVASLRSETRGWCTPEKASSAQLELRGVWHPLTADPVPNDATLIPGKGMVVTGANMTGKSTYLRAVGIAIALGRTLNLVPAASCSGRLPRIHALFGVSDDVISGQSYYIAEALAVVTLLAEARDGEPSLFLLDELLRGTNTIERLAGAEAVLRALVLGSNSSHSAIAATHDGELVSLLSDCFEPFHFSESIVQGQSAVSGGLLFDYRRRSGAATTRTALALLEHSGAPLELIRAARSRSLQLEKGHVALPN